VRVASHWKGAVLLKFFDSLLVHSESTRNHPRPRGGKWLWSVSWRSGVCPSDANSSRYWSVWRKSFWAISGPFVDPVGSSSLTWHGWYVGCIQHDPGDLSSAIETDARGIAIGDWPANLVGAAKFAWIFVGRHRDPKGRELRELWQSRLNIW